MKTGVEKETPRGWLYGYAVLIALFHLWANTLGHLSTLWFNSIHLGLLGSFGFLALSGKVRHWTDWLGAGVLLLAGFFLLFAETPLHERGEVMMLPDKVVAALALLGTMALCRRTSGWVIPILALLGIAYILFLGRYLDGIFHFRGLSLERVLYRFYFTDEGLFGFVATLSATYVFMFILFSAFLLQSGGGEFVLKVARRLTASLPGGGGYVAVIASGLTGMINGSAVANTVATGSVTIPLMKRNGFSPTFAAGLETAASTGGQLLPPIMGAGAFIIAQYTGLSYGVVIAAAALPAILYFFSLLVAVYLEVRRTGAQVVYAEEAPESMGKLLREGLPFGVPLIVLVTLLAMSFSPAYAAGLGMVAIVVASWFTRDFRMGWRQIADALAMGVQLAMPTAILLIMSGVVIGVLNLTGSGVAFSQLLVSWSGGWLFPTLVLVAIASLILGMGLPVTAAYVVLAVVAAPALQELGVALLAAHLIIFWFSQDSNVTPPVCLAAFAAAGIAGSRPLSTGFTAWRLAKALYVIPFLFAYRPLIDGTWGERIAVAGFTACGLVLLFAAMAGWLRSSLQWPARLLALVSALACFWPLWVLNVTGVLLGLVLLGGAPHLNRKKSRNRNKIQGTHEKMTDRG